MWGEKIFSNQQSEITLHEISNNNGVTAVNFTMPANLSRVQFPISQHLGLLMGRCTMR
jgi:hypothetical protein